MLRYISGIAILIFGLLVYRSIGVYGVDTPVWHMVLITALWVVGYYLLAGQFLLGTFDRPAVWLSLFGMVGGFIAYLFLGGLLNENYIEHLLKTSQTTTVSATITRVMDCQTIQISSKYGPLHDYKATCAFYRFTLNGKPRVGKLIARSQGELPREGEVISIKYVNDRPDVYGPAFR